MQYEQYILREVLPLIHSKNKKGFVMTAGCSLGAYHAVNIALRHPHLFGKAIGMSGRYDLTISSSNFKDLFDGYRDENVYFHMPAQYIPNLTDERLLNQVRKLQIVIAVGREDSIYENNVYMHNQLSNKGIPNTLHVWKGEAHKSAAWRQMVYCYL
jgi:esterase/lipase superfamily enzyme